MKWPYSIFFKPYNRRKMKKKKSPDHFSSTSQVGGLECKMLLNCVRKRVTYSSYVFLRRHLTAISIKGSCQTVCDVNLGNSVARWKSERPSYFATCERKLSLVCQGRRGKHSSSVNSETNDVDQSSREMESPVSYTSRTHTCGSLREVDIGKHVRLCGWIQSVHFHGKFIQLRDWDGWTQLVFNDDRTDLLEQVRDLKLESVIEITGLVTERESINKRVPTGVVEVIVDSVNVLNTVPEDVPFMQKSYDDVQESLQMKYRYLALRYKTLQQNLRLRSKFIMKMREFLANRHDFVDVETPTLFRRTPGGAKEFVVPTRIPGKFYSLPQSPQQFKQLLMVGGVDRYFQIAKCYRDEGSKPDRQPEFTQLDVEMSFVTREGIIKLIEELLVHCWPEDKPSINIPFPRMTYDQAMRLYGTDKPDTRFDMKIHTLHDGRENSQTSPATMGIKFQDSINHISKSKLNSHLKVYAKKPRVKWQLYKCSELDKIDADMKQVLTKTWNCEMDDVIVTATGEDTACCELLGIFRTFIADELESKGQVVREPNKFNFLWVLDFPLFLPKEDGEGLESAHHPFTDVHPEDSDLLYNQPEKVRGQHYDLVLNGSEVGGGSIRIHNPEKQKYVLQNVLKEDIEELDHLLKAFTMGCPPHGGIALGLDRLLACILGTNSIRDVIAFPKTKEGKDPMSNSPAEISEEELSRYHISIVREES